MAGSCRHLLMDARRGLVIGCDLFQGAEASPETNWRLSPRSCVFPAYDRRIGRHPCAHPPSRVHLLPAGFKGAKPEPLDKQLPIEFEDASVLGFGRELKQVERGINPLAGEKQRIVFSGGLGAPKVPLLPVSRSRTLCCACIVVSEKSCGDHSYEEHRALRQRREIVIELCLADSGAVLVLALGVGWKPLNKLKGIVRHNRVPRCLDFPEGGRGRDVVAHSSAHPETLGVAQDNTLWLRTPIVLDSPRGIRLTAAYREVQPFGVQETLKRVKFGLRSLSFERSIDAGGHMAYFRAVRQGGGGVCLVIEIADKGMCSSRPVVNCLQVVSSEPRHYALLAGHQAKNTSRKVIQDCGPAGRYLGGRRVLGRVRIVGNGDCSVHADRKWMVNFITLVREWSSGCKWCVAKRVPVCLVSNRKALSSALLQANSSPASHPRK